MLCIVNFSGWAASEMAIQSRRDFRDGNPAEADMSDRENVACISGGLVLMLRGVETGIVCYPHAGA